MTTKVRLDKAVPFVERVLMKKLVPLATAPPGVQLHGTLWQRVPIRQWEDYGIWARIH